MPECCYPAHVDIIFHVRIVIFTYTWIRFYVTGLSLNSRKRVELETSDSTSFRFLNRNPKIPVVSSRCDMVLYRISALKRLSDH